jgi:hypothetical protein
MEFVNGLKNEELVYSHLSPIQGTFVPVLLGSLRLQRPFSYDGIAEIVHLMCMGFAGRPLPKTMRSKSLSDETHRCSRRTIHK